MKTQLISQCLAAAVLSLLPVLPAQAVRSDAQRIPVPPAPDTKLKAAPPRKPSADQFQVAGEAEAFGVKTEWHARQGTPLSIRGPGLGQFRSYSGGKGLALSGGGRYAEDAIAVLDNVSRFYRIQDAQNEFAVKRVESDRLQFHHVRLTQVYRGLRVFGGEVLVHFNAADDAYQVTAGTFRIFKSTWPRKSPPTRRLRRRRRTWRRWEDRREHCRSNPPWWSLRGRWSRYWLLNLLCSPMTPMPGRVAGATGLMQPTGKCCFGTTISKKSRPRPAMVAIRISPAISWRRGWTRTRLRELAREHRLLLSAQHEPSLVCLQHRHQRVPDNNTYAYRTTPDWTCQTAPRCLQPEILT